MEVCKVLGENKERHNIMIPGNLWKIAKELGRIKGKSASEVIEESLLSHIKSNGYSRAYFKLMAVPNCSSEENEELTKALDSLKEEDLKCGGVLES